MALMLYKYLLYWVAQLIGLTKLMYGYLNLNFCLQSFIRYLNVVEEFYFGCVEPRKLQGGRFEYRGRFKIENSVVEIHHT